MQYHRRQRHQRRWKRGAKPPMPQVDCFFGHGIVGGCRLIVFWRDAAKLQKRNQTTNAADWFFSGWQASNAAFFGGGDVALEEATLPMPLERWSQTTNAAGRFLFLDVAPKEANNAAGWLFFGWMPRRVNVANATFVTVFVVTVFLSLSLLLLPSPILFSYFCHFTITFAIAVVVVVFLSYLCF